MSNARNLADLLAPGENTLQTVAIETDRIILNGTDGSATNAGDDLLLDASAASTDVGERFTYEDGTDDGSAVLSGGDLKFNNVEILMNETSLIKSGIGDTTTNIGQGLAKVAFNMNLRSAETAGIANNGISTECLNISSGTDAGTGLSRGNITSAMQNKQYIWVTGSLAANNTQTIDVGVSTTSLVACQQHDADSSTITDQIGCVLIHGDLA